MREVDESLFKKALEILTVAFDNNPGVLWVVKKDNKVKLRIRELCKFCLNTSLQKKGAYISEDRNGVALMIKSWKKQSFLNWLFGYYRLGQYCIGWFRALKIINRERVIQSRRPAKRHLYVWMLAVKDHTNGLNTIKEMRDFLFECSRKEQLPLYAETTMRSTLNLYLRYGFEVYDTWETNEDGITVYFIRRDWRI